jgi:hypothetical protein
MRSARSEADADEDVDRLSVPSEPPVTYYVDVASICSQLDHAEMLGLAEMFERWAFEEQGITDDRRTRLIQYCVDLERIAAWVGPDHWPSGDGPRTFLQFLADMQ